MTKTHSKNIELFHETIDKVKKYLIVLDPNLIDWNDVEDEYTQYDDETADWKKYRLHEMVMACLQDKKYKQDLLDSYGIKYLGVFEGYDNDGESYEDAIIQINNRYFKTPYFDRHYFDEIREVKPVKKTVYEEIT